MWSEAIRFWFFLNFFTEDHVWISSLTFYIFLWVCILSIIRISSCDLTIFENNKLDFHRYCFLKTSVCHACEVCKSLTYENLWLSDIWYLETSKLIQHSFIFFYILILLCFELWLLHHQIMTFTCLILKWISSCNHNLDQWVMKRRVNF